MSVSPTTTTPTTVALAAFIAKFAAEGACEHAAKYKRFHPNVQNWNIANDASADCAAIFAISAGRNLIFFWKLETGDW